MAGELPPVVVEFQASIEPLLEDLQRLVDRLGEIRGAGDGADSALSDLGRNADGAAGHLDILKSIAKETGDKIDEIKDAAHKSRDALIELDGSLDATAGSAIAAGIGASLAGGAFDDLAASAGAADAPLAAADAEAGGGAGAFAALGTAIQDAAGSASFMLGAILLLIPVLLSLVGIVGVLVAPLAAFALVALPTLIAVFDAITGKHNALAATGDVINTLVTNVKNLIADFKILAQSMQPAVIEVLNAALNVLAQLLPYIGTLANIVGPILANMFNSIANAIQGQGFASAIAWIVKNFPEMFKLFEQIVVAIGEFIGALIRIGAAMAPIVIPLLVGFLHILNNIFNFLASHPELAKFAAILLLVAGSAIVLLAALAPLIALMGAVGVGIAALILILVAVVAAVIAFHKQIIGAFDDVRHNIATWVSDIVKNLGVVGQAFLSLPHLWVQYLHDAWEAIIKGTEAAWKAVEKAVVDALAVVGQFIVNGAEGWLNLIKSGWDNIVGAVKSGTSTVISVISSWAGNVINSFVSLLNSIISTIGNWAGSMFTAGWNLMVGLWNGLVGMGNKILGYVEGFAKSVANIFSTVWHMFSPSQLAFSHGQNFMLGLLGGFQAGTPALMNHMNNVAYGIAAISNGLSATGVSAGVSAAGAGYSSAGSAASSAPSGDIVVQVDGQALFRLSKSQVYNYNVNNGGVATGVIIPR